MPSVPPAAPLPRRAADRYSGACPSQAAMATLALKWAAPVVGRLARGSARFRQLQGDLVRPDGRPVSAKVLASVLQRLAEVGVSERDASGAGVRYQLTARGRALVPILDALGHWAETA